MKRARIKVCCIASLEEAELAIDCGADALGLVGHMPSGPGVIDDDLAREIAGAVPPAIETFLLTSHETGPEIADHVAYCGASTVQIVRHIAVAEYAAITARLPTTKRVQVIHVENEGASELIRVYEPFVHAFLLDSGSPAESTAILGGTGRAHDWQISARIVRSTSRPVFLAGGLNADNVREALRVVSPFGVDLCSGVRTNGKLDAEKLRRFVSQVW